MTPPPHGPPGVDTSAGSLGATSQDSAQLASVVAQLTTMTQHMTDTVQQLAASQVTMTHQLQAQQASAPAAPPSAQSQPVLLTHHDILGPSSHHVPPSVPNSPAFLDSMNIADCHHSACMCCAWALASHPLDTPIPADVPTSLNGHPTHFSAGFGDTGNLHHGSYCGLFSGGDDGGDDGADDGSPFDEASLGASTDSAIHDPAFCHDGFNYAATPMEILARHREQAAQPRCGATWSEYTFQSADHHANVIVDPDTRNIVPWHAYHANYGEQWNFPVKMDMFSQDTTAKSRPVHCLQLAYLPNLSSSCSNAELLQVCCNSVDPGTRALNALDLWLHQMQTTRSQYYAQFGEEEVQIHQSSVHCDGGSMTNTTNRDDLLWHITELTPANHCIALKVADDHAHYPQKVGFLHVLTTDDAYGYRMVHTYFTPTLPATIISPYAMGHQFHCRTYSSYSSLVSSDSHLGLHHCRHVSEDIHIPLQMVHGLLFTQLLIPPTCATNHLSLMPHPQLHVHLLTAKELAPCPPALDTLAPFTPLSTAGEGTCSTSGAGEGSTLSSAAPTDCCAPCCSTASVCCGTTCLVPSPSPPPSASLHDKLLFYQCLSFQPNVTNGQLHLSSTLSALTHELQSTNHVVMGFAGPRMTNVQVGILIWKVEDDNGKVTTFQDPNKIIQVNIPQWLHQMSQHIHYLIVQAICFFCALTLESKIFILEFGEGVNAHFGACVC